MYTRLQHKLEKGYDDNQFTLTELLRFKMLGRARAAISRGVDVNEIDFHYREAPLHIASEMGHTGIIKLLINAGADVNLKSGNGRTPLSYARDVASVKLLVFAGADINRECRFGLLLAHDAVSRQNLSIFKFLMQSFDVDVDVRTPYSLYTPLHVACSAFYCHNNGFSEKTVRFLIKNGADFNAICSRNQTPIMLLIETYYTAVDESAKRIFRFLLKYSDVSDIKSNYIPVNRLYQIYLEHIVVLLSLGVTVKSYQSRLDQWKYHKNYFDRCTNELLLAKSTKLRNSWITFYHLLVGSKKKLKNYAGNEDLIDDFKNKSDLSKTFPIYGAQMQKKVSQGIKRREIFDKSCTFLSYHLPIFNPYHLIVRDILDNIVSFKDLSKFCHEKV